MKVTIIGATGETGGSIVCGLLKTPSKFEITTITRKSSVDSPKNQALRDAGVKVIAADITGPEGELVEALQGADTVIAALTIDSLPHQIALATAAKKAGVKRFVPSFFATAAAPKGVTKIRDVKEKVSEHARAIGLPCTIIDVGWWYQLSIPRLPSGRIDDLLILPAEGPVGDGSVPCAYIDSADIGRYVARIINDPTTVNKSILAYNEVLTQRQIWETLEKVSGEEVAYNYIPTEKVQENVDTARRANDAAGPDDIRTMLYRTQFEYQLSMNVRGDNTPEKAKEKGYLITKELYPDVEYTGFEDWLRKLLHGSLSRPYSERSQDTWVKEVRGFASR